uniref:Uncharacterized protein n=1 Tax=Populus alba TaxID=43335 RepID=A0A4U5PXJ9_POPAL|nr:hypothetical protein D5086_0000171000 [Populus alba]
MAGRRTAIGTGRAKAGGNLAEEKKLLSLAWREVGGGLGSLPEAGGSVGGELGAAAAVAEQKQEATLRRKKKLLSLAWREVGGGLGSLPEAGGSVGGELGAAAAGCWFWSPLQEGEKRVLERRRKSSRLELLLWLRRDAAADGKDQLGEE